MSFLRHPFTLLGVNLAAIGTSTYILRSHHIYNLEEHEARSDEVEGTLRGHIGLIEEALDRIEGKTTEADRGKKMFVGYSPQRAPNTDQFSGMSTMANEVETRSNHDGLCIYLAA